MYSLRLVKKMMCWFSKPTSQDKAKKRTCKIKEHIQIFEKILHHTRKDDSLYSLSFNVQVKDAVHAVDPGLLSMACGSYRRGKATCGDVDVLITQPDGKSHKGVFSKLLQSLRDSGKFHLL